MAKIQSLSIKNFVSPLDTVVRSDEESTLGTVLSLVDSSHDAVFIFNKAEKFLGLISPFKTLYSRNYPYTTKVSSIVFVPPAITEDTPVYTVAEHMLASKIYVLPVFDEESNLKGVVHGKDIMQAITEDSDLLEFVKDNIELRTPVTAPITASVKEVFYDLKKKGVSRIVLTDEGGALAGIVTRGDLMQSLIKPTAKMRFPNEGSRIGFYSLAGEKAFRKGMPVTKYHTAMVDHLPDTTSKSEVISHLITSKHDSIILTDKLSKPTSFLSMRDILQTLVMLQPDVDVPLIIKKPGKSVSDEEYDRVVDFLQLFAKKLRKRMRIEKIEVTSKEPKNNAGVTKMFNITLIVTPVAGKSIVSIVKKRSFFDGIQDATATVEKQYRRSGLSKSETY